MLRVPARSVSANRISPRRTSEHVLWMRNQVSSEGTIMSSAALSASGFELKPGGLSALFLRFRFRGAL
jgi:hypothetical protein